MAGVVDQIRQTPSFYVEALRGPEGEISDTYRLFHILNQRNSGNIRLDGQTDTYVDAVNAVLDFQQVSWGKYVGGFVLAADIAVELDAQLDQVFGANN